MADVGVLLVHGIGDQTHGATVEQASNALLGVLGGFERSGDYRLAISDATIHPDAGPPRMELMIGPDDESDELITWILAEATWAEAFHPPSLSQMVGWSTIYVYRVALRLLKGREYRARPKYFQDPLYARWMRHRPISDDGEQGLEAIADRLESDHPGTDRERVLAQLRRYDEDYEASLESLPDYMRGIVRFARSRGGPIKWYFVSFLGLLTSGVFTALPLLLLPIIVIALLPVVLILLLFLSVLAVVPGVPSPIRSIRVGLERSVGDAFVLTKNGFGRAAMLNAVYKEILWLDDQCDKIVVIAHSQGSVIVEQLLEREDVAELVDFTIVYGSAIGLLRPAGQQWSSSANWKCLRAKDDPINPLPLRRHIKLDGLGIAEGGWFDGENEDDVVVHSWNRLINDHTTYWSNREDFVLRVVRTLSEIEANINPSTTAERLSSWGGQLWERTRVIRRFRGFSTRASRAMAIVTVGVVIASKGARLIVDEIGSWLFEASAWVIGLLPDEFTLVEAVIEYLHGPRTAGHFFAGLAVVLLGISVAVRWVVWAPLSVIGNRIWHRAVSSPHSIPTTPDPLPQPTEA